MISLDVKMISLDEIREQWSKTYSSDGKPDWSHIFPHYHDDIVFQDSIQRIEGKKDFVLMCNRLAKRCKSLQMEIYSMTQTDRIVMMDWKMTMSLEFSRQNQSMGQPN